MYYHALIQYSVSSKSWVLPQSASDYNVGANIPVGVAGPGGRWTSGTVPASASLYSMSSGSSSISGIASEFSVNNNKHCANFYLICKKMPLKATNNR